MLLFKTIMNTTKSVERFNREKINILVSYLTKFLQNSSEMRKNKKIFERYFKLFMVFKNFKNPSRSFVRFKQPKKN